MVVALYPVETPYPTLPSTWTPPSSCLASTAYYMAIVSTEPGSYDKYAFWNMFGNPTPIDFGTPSGPPCLPTSFAARVPYLTDGPCPSGYSVACATKTSYNQDPASIVTCCPSGAFTFSCYDNDYGCGYSQPYTTGVTWTGWRTDLYLTPPMACTTPTSSISSTTSSSVMSTTATFPTFSPTALPSHTVVTPSPTSDTRHEPVSSSSAGINSSAKVGIGVGAAVGSLLLLNIALLLRRDWQKREVQKTSAVPESAGVAIYSEEQPAYKPPADPAELFAESPHVRGPHPVELPER
ncbi:hypothetical protein O1611_g9933 [Lasiodiplodia mahajangana]|uniref:Uncharacterized protein n=1 Tax=Lasiodiplodia mahajangana TaxID=1108764 RepID=A0ACC2J428_9PEZI|nr:hypothetical protein O1611_g9933 [Lasiodiplodia mahajangana]